MITPEANPQTFSSTSWHACDAWLLTYFFLPVPIFLAGIFQPWLGLPAAVLVCAAFIVSRPFVIRSDALSRGWVGWALILGLATAWVSLGGAGHIFFANHIDWVPRYSVLRDLTVFQWPPRYLDLEGQEAVMRAPLGYYLLPALLAKVAGLRWADFLLLVWTWVGLILFFLANFRGRPLVLLVALVFFISASGMDIIGTLWKSDGSWPLPGGHIEWWTGRMKFSSNATMLYWIPNHVLPGWALGAWLWRFQLAPDILHRLPLIALAVVVWSPLPLVAALPLIAALAWQHRSLFINILRRMSLSIGLIMPATLLIAAYFSMSATQISGWVITPSPEKLFKVAGGNFGWLGDTVLFLMVEVAFFGLLALQFSRSPLLIASVVLLCILPFMSFGPTNDLATLGAIPALTVLWLTLIDELVRPTPLRRLTPRGRALLVLLFAIGSITPFQESYRALTRGHWEPDMTLPAPVALGGFAVHYFARGDAVFAAMLRDSDAIDSRTMDWPGTLRR